MSLCPREYLVVVEKSPRGSFTFFAFNFGTGSHKLKPSGGSSPRPGGMNFLVHWMETQRLKTHFLEKVHRFSLIAVSDETDTWWRLPSGFVESGFGTPPPARDAVLEPHSPLGSRWALLVEQSATLCPCRLVPGSLALVRGCGLRSVLLGNFDTVYSHSKYLFSDLLLLDQSVKSPLHLDSFDCVVMPLLAACLLEISTKGAQVKVQTAKTNNLYHHSLPAAVSK